ncbi:MAG: hypothetical protein LBL07_19305 [Tannerella sp.]|jgi:hypothetical protein|nr:hypothetical protein [Tannerella sp.]
MKRFAAILLLTVTVFSVAAPAWERYGESMFRICLSGSECDDDDDCSASDRGDAGYCSGCCSPFYACGSCHGFELVTQATILPAQAIQTVIPISQVQPYSTAFCEEIRQPPKFT